MTSSMPRGFHWHTSVSSINKSELHNVTEILLKVVSSLTENIFLLFHNNDHAPLTFSHPFLKCQCFLYFESVIELSPFFLPLAWLATTRKCPPSILKYSKSLAVHVGIVWKILNFFRPLCHLYIVELLCVWSFKP